MKYYVIQPTVSVKCSAAEESDCSSALPDCVSIQMSGDQSIPNPSGSGDNIE